MLCYAHSHSIRGSVYHAVFGTQSPHQAVCHAMWYRYYTGGKGLTLYKILISNMPCILALFCNLNVHQHFDKSIPQSAIPKPTWGFVQGNRSKLKFKHNAQPATIKIKNSLPTFCIQEPWDTKHIVGYVKGIVKVLNMMRWL